MTKRLLLLAIMALAVSFVACGGDDNGPTPVPTPTPVTTSVITFFLDPPTVVANDEGGGNYAFKVNLGFHESAGVGFTINTILSTISTTGGAVVSNVTYVSGRHVPAFGDYAVQNTVRFQTSGGRVPLTARFTVNFIDDNLHALTATAQVNVLHNGEPKRLP